MKKPTRDELQAECDRLRRQQTLMSFAVQALVGRERPDATERYDDERGGTYTLRLYRADAAHGGFVLTTFAYEGQRDHTGVDYLDDLDRCSRFIDCAELARATAVGRLCRARSELLRRAEQPGGAP